MEEWRPVVGYEGLYEVSSLGSVQSLDRIVAREPTFLRVRGRVLRAQTNCQSGYKQVGLSRDGVREMLYVHALVLRAFVGPCPDGMEACHGEAGKRDNALTNLRWDTPTENNYDWVRSGTHHYARRNMCKWGHSLPPASLGASRICGECRQDNMTIASAKRTMVRMLVNCGLA